MSWALYLFVGAPFILFMGFGFVHLLMWLKSGRFAFGAFMTQVGLTWVAVLVTSPMIPAVRTLFGFVKAVGSVGSGCVNC
jgi:hypothetical protein